METLVLSGRWNTPSSLHVCQSASTLVMCIDRVVMDSNGRTNFLFEVMGLLN
jgi:hypothetical protein